MQPFQVVFIHEDLSIETLDVSSPLHLCVENVYEEDDDKLSHPITVRSLVGGSVSSFAWGTKEEMTALLLLITGLKGNVGNQPGYHQGVAGNQGFGNFTPPPPNPFFMGPRTIVTRTHRNHLADEKARGWRTVCEMLSGISGREISKPRNLHDQITFTIM